MRAKEIRELVKIVESSTVGEIEITRWFWGKIRISKTATHVTAVTPAVSPVQVQAPVPVVQQEAPAAPSQAPAATEVAAPVESSNTIEIKAPMVGTFYRSPAPDAQPYIKEGDVISQGKVLCIIEAMKLMNEIEAEVSGKIVKILVENAQPVEYNQPLFLVEPS